jgi:hypothetical protein
MMKFTKAALALAVALPVYAEDSAIDWSSTPADIRSQESSVPQDASDKRITYETIFKGESYHLEYLFGDTGTLVNVLYYKSYPAKGSDCMAEYHRVRKSHEEELGEATTEIAPDDSVIAEYGAGNECVAVAEGKLAGVTNWTLHSNTNVSVQLSVWKGSPYVGISSTPVADQ